MIKSLKQKEFSNNRVGKSISALQTLIPYIRPYRWRLFGAAFALLMITIAMLSLGRGLAFIVDEGLAGNNPAFLSVSIILTIAIARSILREPTIMLLDEATSALDSQSEALVQKALRKLCSDKTSVVVAHRLSTVIDADRIFVMDKGKIVAEGSHEKLLLHSELYHQLAKNQLLSD